MHAGLSNKAKSQLCDLFNDPESTFKVLIMMYDVGAVGLNLHIACDRVLSLAIPISEGQSAQVAGRANRVSKFQVLAHGAQKYFRTPLLIYLTGDVQIQCDVHGQAHT